MPDRATPSRGPSRPLAFVGAAMLALFLGLALGRHFGLIAGPVSAVVGVAHG